MARTVVVACVLGLAFAAFLLASEPAAAHRDPADCTTNGVGVAFVAFRSDATTPIAGSQTVQSGETIFFQVRLSALPSPNCTYGGGPNGQVTITTPDGVEHVVVAPGNVPHVTGASPFSSPTQSYVVSESDVANGKLLASGALKDAISHTGGASAFEQAGHDITGATVTRSINYDDVSLDVSKTATAAFDEECEWDINKTAEPTSHTMQEGQAGTTTYTIELTLLGCAEANHRVSGTITITNPAQFADATITDVTDEVSGAGALAVDCPVTFPFDLGPGQTLECTYEGALPDGQDRTNTATATTSGDVGGGSGEAPVVFPEEPENCVNCEVNVDDTFDAGDGGPFTTSSTYTYERTFECGPGEEQFQGEGNLVENTATIVETGQSDDATVEVNCVRVALEVSKTADPSFDREAFWDIVKDVDVAHHELEVGESGTSTYTLTVTKTASEDSNHAVAGTITITNPAEVAATIESVSDEISGVGAAQVDCPVTFPHSLAPGATLECTYEGDLPDGETRTNTATVTTSGDVDGGSGEATIDFTGVEPTTCTNCEVNVDDTFDEGDHGPLSSSSVHTYTRTFTCGAGDGHFQGKDNLVENTATIVETGQSDDALVEIDCLVPPGKATCDAYALSVDIAPSLTLPFGYSSIQSKSNATGSALRGASASDARQEGGETTLPAAMGVISTRELASDCMASSIDGANVAAGHAGLHKADMAFDLPGQSTDGVPGVQLSLSVRVLREEGASAGGVGTVPGSATGGNLGNIINVDGVLESIPFQAFVGPAPANSAYPIKLEPVPSVYAGDLVATLYVNEQSSVADGCGKEGTRYLGNALRLEIYDPDPMLGPPVDLIDELNVAMEVILGHVETMTCPDAGEGDAFEAAAACTAHAIGVDIKPTALAGGGYSTSFSNSEAAAGAPNGNATSRARDVELAITLPGTTPGSPSLGSIVAEKVESGCNADVSELGATAAGFAIVDPTTITLDLPAPVNVHGAPGIQMSLNVMQFRERGASTDGVGHYPIVPPDGTGANDGTMILVTGELEGIPFGAFVGPTQPDYTGVVEYTLPLMLGGDQIGRIIINEQDVVPGPCGPRYIGNAMRLVVNDPDPVTGPPTPVDLFDEGVPAIEIRVSHVETTTCGPDVEYDEDPLPEPRPGLADAVRETADEVVPPLRLEAPEDPSTPDEPEGEHPPGAAASCYAYALGVDAPAVGLSERVGPSSGTSSAGGDASFGEGMAEDAFVDLGPMGSARVIAAASACSTSVFQNANAFGAAVVDLVDLELDVPGADLDGTPGLQLEVGTRSLGAEASSFGGGGASVFGLQGTFEGIPFGASVGPTPENYVVPIPGVMAGDSAGYAVLNEHATAPGPCGDITIRNALRVVLFEPAPALGTLDLFDETSVAVEVTVSHVEVSACEEGDLAGGGAVAGCQANGLLLTSAGSLDMVPNLAIGFANAQSGPAAGHATSTGEANDVVLGPGAAILQSKTLFAACETEGADGVGSASGHAGAEDLYLETTLPVVGDVIVDLEAAHTDAQSVAPTTGGALQGSVTVGSMVVPVDVGSGTQSIPIMVGSTTVGTLTVNERTPIPGTCSGSDDSALHLQLMDPFAPGSVALDLWIGRVQLTTCAPA